MTIFIPVLWVCINAHCEFMQQTRHFVDEAQCKESVVQQKQKMRDLAQETDATITTLEGTCIDATVKRFLMPDVTTGQK